MADCQSTYYRMAISEFPENLNALTSLALAFFELQKYPESLDYYSRAAQISPDDPVPMQKVAEIQERLGDLGKATKAYMDVAELFARNRDVEKAIRSWSHVVALNPENMTAHTRLALVYERLGRTSHRYGRIYFHRQPAPKPGKYSKSDPNHQPCPGG